MVQNHMKIGCCNTSSFIQCVFFYSDKRICSFGPFKIASDIHIYLKIFVWLEHLIKIHLEYFEK